MLRIGFVGLGHMGLPMAKNLLKAGYTVTGFDLQPLALQHWIDAGGIAAQNLREVASNQDIIITMLQTGSQVLQVCDGETGLFNAAATHTLFIDCSSIDVQNSHVFHQLAAEKNFLALDAPVSGGVAGAIAATLTFMVGGEARVFEKAYPILTTMGKNIIHTGNAGSGQAAKICNNLILGVSMIAVSEAFVLAQQLGLSAQKLFDVVSHSSGQCWVMNHYVPVPDILERVPANHHYTPGFTAAMMLKDLKLSQHSAGNVNIKTPMAALATTLYQQLCDNQMSELDFSAIIKLLENNREQ